MSQTISFKNNFSKLIVIAFECFPSKKFSALCLFYQGFLKYRHISKTRVFEKRLSQLHCVICCLFTVKKSLSMSHTISCKSNFLRLIVIAFECFPTKPLSEFCLFYQGFLKYRHISKTRVFKKRFSQLHCVICCLFTVKNSLSMSHRISCKSNISQTYCYCLRMFPFQEIFRLMPILSRFSKISPHL